MRHPFFLGRGAFFLALACSFLEAGAPMPDGRRLRDIVVEKFPKKNFYIGAAIGYNALKEEGIDLEILDREFNYVTPENEFKMSAIHPTPAAWSWEKADAWVAHAKKANQIIRAHGPISPQCGKWALEDNRTAEELGSHLNEFLEALYRKYNGNPLIPWIDVVNETIETKGEWFGPAAGTDKWENPWTLIGFDSDENRTPLYLGMAFAKATKLAPNMRLVLNQHQITQPAIRKLKETVLYLKGKGHRVDALGWQAHVELGWETKGDNLQDLHELITWTHREKMDFHITEFNVALPAKPVPDEAGQTAETFAGILRALLEHRDQGLVTWGCWHVRDYVVRGKVRTCLPFDAQGAPNKSYYAMQALLENPPEALR